MDKSEETVFFDAPALLRRAEGDPAFLRELIKAFGQSQAESLAGLRAAIDTGAAAAVEEQAHSLKGALQNFVSGKAVALAYRLELMGRNSELQDAAAALRALEDEVSRVSAHLRKVCGELR